ncbi:AAA+ family ATPase [Leptolyngbya sp. 'hensonii']|nr:AAA+ family ATPase [Leptolyngbya sp. 'hensonii']
MKDSPTNYPMQALQRQADALLIYQSVLQNEIGQAFLALLETFIAPRDERAALQAYGRWFRALADQNLGWQDYLCHEIAQAENPFTRQVQHTNLADLPLALVTAVQQDLRSLQALYHCPPTQLSQWLREISTCPTPPVPWASTITATDLLPSLQQAEDWGTALADLATHYRQQGTGLFARYRALRWQAGQLMGVAYPDPGRLSDLAGHEWQREQLIKNTEFLLAGLPALHVLLYGSRGSGKSSLVKALLQEYGDRGLRLVEVAKTDLADLPAILDRLRQVPQKFILFVDDLSFEEDDDAFKALKVVLEGGLTARPQNIVVYATSNRRHLIREFFADRPRPSAGDEVHSWDTVQEKLSFSDRFGLTLTFEPADQKTYLAIVHHLATRHAICLAPDDLEHRALQWATRHNGRSGRTARQFIDFLKADLTLTQETP